MKEAKHIRKKKIIHNLEEGNNKGRSFDSINLAKKASHKLQMEEDGALGRGTVVVDKPE